MMRLAGRIWIWLAWAMSLALIAGGARHAADWLGVNVWWNVPAVMAIWVTISGTRNPGLVP